MPPNDLNGHLHQSKDVTMASNGGNGSGKLSAASKTDMFQSLKGGLNAIKNALKQKKTIQVVRDRDTLESINLQRI